MGTGVPVGRRPHAATAGTGTAGYERQRRRDDLGWRRPAGSGPTSSHSATRSAGDAAPRDDDESAASATAGDHDDATGAHDVESAASATGGDHDDASAPCGDYDDVPRNAAARNAAARDDYDGIARHDHTPCDGLESAAPTTGHNHHDARRFGIGSAASTTPSRTVSSLLEHARGL